MLTLFAPFLFLLTSSWITSQEKLWRTLITQSMFVAVTSVFWFSLQYGFTPMNPYFCIDEISAPLIILTFWLTAPTLLASQSKLMKEPIFRQRAYISIIITLQAMTVAAFMADNMIFFFILFESTLIPTLVVITRWGNQKERILAGTYFMFYAMFGSMALLTALLFFHSNFGTTSITLIKMSSIRFPQPFSSIIWWSASLFTFLIKMPLYGVHLWLPKAHTEAPIAGSMILAGTLLKLGGYGIIRINAMAEPSLTINAQSLIMFSLFGVLMTAILCSRQTDLKSMIAFSSVSHMGLVIVASMVSTSWSLPGAMMLMVSHGLISSTLFCLANTSYERLNTRTLSLLQGTQIIFPLISAWWLLATLFNMALPPSTNFMAELSVLASLFQWSNLSLAVAGLSVIMTTIYSLYLFWTSQRNIIPPLTEPLSPSQSREHLLLSVHLIPALLLVVNPGIIF